MGCCAPLAAYPAEPLQPPGGGCVHTLCRLSRQRVMTVSARVAAASCHLARLEARDKSFSPFFRVLDSMFTRPLLSSGLDEPDASLLPSSPYQGSTQGTQVVGVGSRPPAGCGCSTQASPPPLCCSRGAPNCRHRCGSYQPLPRDLLWRVSLISP